MKFIIAHLRLIRWPNLVFIALTQLLYFYFLVPALARQSGVYYSSTLEPILYCLVAASVLIAAAGYIINDYFDINIDVVNKPERVVVDMVIHRRWAMLLHFVFSAAGLMLSLYVSMRVKNNWILVGNSIAVLLLWFYSTTFKRKLLSGNIIISLLTAWVIIVLYFFTGGDLLAYGEFRAFDAAAPIDFKKLYLLTLLYAAFAFIVSLIREVVKDIEDMEGDDRYGCKTLPLVWGVPAAKLFCGVWLAVLFASLSVIFFYAILSGWLLPSLYLLVFIILPVAWISALLYKASKTADYSKLSSMVKLLMLTGILSMLFIKFLS